jgi:diacylglycerol kinase
MAYFLKEAMLMINRWMKSARHAVSGLRYAFQHERNFRIECGIGITVFVLIWIFPLASWERALVLAMIGWVLSAELTNTIVERMVDMFKPRLHPYARVIKDVMAASVLLSALSALAVGLAIFVPHIAPWLR